MDITIVVNIIKIIFYPFRIINNFLIFLDRGFIEKKGNKYYWRLQSKKDYKNIKKEREHLRGIG